MSLPADFRALAASFRRYLRASNKSPRTVETYGEAVDQLGEWLSDHDDAPATTGELKRGAPRLWQRLWHLWDLQPWRLTTFKYSTDPQFGASVDDLTAAIRAFIDAWNDRCEPFVWTKTADDILARLKPQTISATATVALMLRGRWSRRMTSGGRRFRPLSGS
jgi:hypothetical protein